MLEFSDEPLVSQDIVGNPHSCIFDSKLTMMHGGKFVKVVGWYDNEWGYSNRCVEMLEMTWSIIVLTAWSTNFSLEERKNDYAISSNPA